MEVVGVILVIGLGLLFALIGRPSSRILLLVAGVTGVLGSFTLFVLPYFLSGWFATQLYRLALMGGILLVLSGGMFFGLLVKFLMR